MDSFIYQKKLLNADECKSIITFFNNNKKLHYSGVTAAGVNLGAKVSTDFPGTFQDSDGKFENEVSELIASKLNIAVGEYKQKYPELDDMYPWSLLNGFNIQRYYPGQGFKAIHCENNSKYDNTVLAWMFYLNTVEDGGTLFTSYDLVTDCVEGRLVIWPAYWTHCHRGITSNTKTKYIATGWTCYI